jgi:hypothetical protein
MSQRKATREQTLHPSPCACPCPLAHPPVLCFSLLGHPVQGRRKTRHPDAMRRRATAERERQGATTQMPARCAELRATAGGAPRRGGVIPRRRMRVGAAKLIRHGRRGVARGRPGSDSFSRIENFELLPWCGGCQSNCGGGAWFRGQQHHAIRQVHRWALRCFCTDVYLRFQRGRRLVQSWRAQGQAWLIIEFLGGPGGGGMRLRSPRARSAPTGDRPAGPTLSWRVGPPIDSGRGGRAAACG